MGKWSDYMDKHGDEEYAASARAFAHAVKTERAACAKIAGDIYAGCVGDDDWSDGYRVAAEKIEEEINARGKA